MKLRDAAISAANEAIASVLPERATRETLSAHAGEITGRVVLISIGKAAWRMASAAHEILGRRVARGCVVTKDGHSMGPIGSLEIFEAAHPVPEARNLDATRRAVSMTEGLLPEDTVLFLISGGGSALFELPLDGISLEDTADMTSQLLACGADIVEINTLRKRISSVKGGKFAQICAPARVFSIVLSDVLGDRLDSIASGPAYPDSSTSADAVAIARKHGLKLPGRVWDAFSAETPKQLDNVSARIAGSVSALCDGARKVLAGRGFGCVNLLTTTLDCDASEAGAFFAALAREAVRARAAGGESVAFVAGGETVVKLKGSGKGGRCQEMALSAALRMEGLPGVVFLAAGSDGTDGPTDAAGGLADGGTAGRIRAAGLDPSAMLGNNDAYHALSAAGDLFMTGPTGTNVNDLFLLLAE